MSIRTVSRLTSEAEALTHCVFCDLNSEWVSIESVNSGPIGIYRTIRRENGQNVGLNANQRRFLQLALDSRVKIEPFDGATLPNSRTESITISGKNINGFTEAMLTAFTQQLRPIVLNRGEAVTVIVNDTMFTVTLTGSTHKSVIVSACEFVFLDASGAPIIATDAPRALFKPESLAKLRVGGLTEHIDTLFTRVFMSRSLPDAYIEQLGLSHVRGMILYGPPGCGKTLLARSIAREMLQVPKDQVHLINGPELLNKYVGQSEENVRALFQPAEKNPNKVYVYIFDEFDALGGIRSGATGGAGARDGVVNQLLTKIDGVDSLANIIVIGCTNRLDLIDPALLRPGRFEVHLRIGLPDAKAREEILKIHASKLIETGAVNPYILSTVADKCENFSGADIEALVKATTFRVLRRHVDMETLDTTKLIAAKVQITLADFLTTTTTMRPSSLGPPPPAGRRPSEETAAKFARDIVVNFSDGRQVFVFYGNTRKSGKTATACHLIDTCGLAYTRYIGARDVFGMNESARNDLLVRLNDRDVPPGLIVLDDIEVLLGASLGHYSPSILQTIKTMCMDHHNIVLCARHYDTLERFNLCEDATVTRSF